MRVLHDRNESFYDGDGEFDMLHATVYRPSHMRSGWECNCITEMHGDRAEQYTYGETLPLTLKMAKEIAERFVTGRKIPKRLEWR